MALGAGGNDGAALIDLAAFRFSAALEVPTGVSRDIVSCTTGTVCMKQLEPFL